MHQFHCALTALAAHAAAKVFSVPSELPDKWTLDAGSVGAQGGGKHHWQHVEGNDT